MVADFGGLGSWKGNGIERSRIEITLFNVDGGL